MNLKLLALLIPGLFAMSLAQASAFVDSVQPPAWVERDNIRIALQPGMELSTDDRLRTGGNGKVLLRLSEGSDVKLGEEVQLNVEKLEAYDASSDSVFQSALNVLQGAFRFSTTLLGQNRKRDIDIQIGTATIGIRGTDVWGKADADRDFVVLLEGKIELKRGNEKTVVMDKPLTIYDAPRGGVADPVTAVDMDKLNIWAQETELEFGRGVITHKGKHRVYLASYLSEALADESIREFQDKGYPVEPFRIRINDRDWVRLGISGFDTQVDADFFKRAADRRFGIADAWISQ